MLNRKTINILIMVSMIVFMAFNIASADIESVVKGYATQGGAVIEEEVNRVSTELINLARGIFITLAVAFLIWAGFIYWGANGDPQKMMLAKKMLAGFVVCMIFVFMTEKIIGSLLGIIGYDIPTEN